MTRCHCKLNQIKEARDVLATLTAMTLNAAQKEEVALLAEELVKTEQQGSVSQQEPKKEEEKEEEEKDDSQGPSSPLQVAESEAQGRFVVAGRDILIGETILAEEPHAAVPYAKQFGTHCQLCLKRTETFLPCSVCTTAVFCSKHCLKIAQGSFHPHECRINGILEVLGCSQIARLALRMLVMRPATTYLADREKAESSSEIYHLADNNAYRWGEDRKMRAFMVGCIFRTLKCHSAYLEEVDDKGGESFLAFLLLKNVQVLQFNAHEIYEVVRSGKSLIPNKSLGVGLGIYARASYFNHSCYGGVTR